MIDPAAACARGRARPSRSRTQGEANVGAIGEPEDADPAPVSRVIRVRGVARLVIYYHHPFAPVGRGPNETGATPPALRQIRIITLLAAALAAVLVVAGC